MHKYIYIYINTNRCGKCKVILGSAGLVLRVWLVEASSLAPRTVLFEYSLWLYQVSALTNTVRIVKMACVCGNPSIAVLLCRYKCNSEDTNAALEDSWAKLHRVLESYVCTNSALFGRSLLCLQRKPYNSQKSSDLWKKPSDLRRRLHHKRILEKRSECRHHFFLTGTIGDSIACFYFAD